MRNPSITHTDHPTLSAQLREWRFIWELRLFLRDQKAILASCRRGDGGPVLVIPGFLAGDAATLVLRRFLIALGYVAYGWQQGINTGPTPVVVAQLLAQVKELQRKHQRKVTLIGWSLGGIYARELARLSPRDVEIVVTLGSPLRGQQAVASNLWTLFILMNRHTLQALSEGELANRYKPVPVRSVALYSRGDGIVNWECCTTPANLRSRNVEVHSSHVGMVFSRDALKCIAEQIAPRYPQRMVR